MTVSSEESNSVTTIASGGHILMFDDRLYSPVVIKKAAYKYASKFASVLELTDDGIKVTIDFHSDVLATDVSEVLRAFKNEVNDQDLREIIASETEVTRNLILAEAFSRTSLLQDEG